VEVDQTHLRGGGSLHLGLRGLVLFLEAVKKAHQDFLLS
jgi:hypothetical protein